MGEYWLRHRENVARGRRGPGCWQLPIVDCQLLKALVTPLSMKYLDMYFLPPCSVWVYQSRCAKRLKLVIGWVDVVEHSNRQLDTGLGARARAKARAESYRTRIWRENRELPEHSLAPPSCPSTHTSLSFWQCERQGLWQLADWIWRENPYLPLFPLSVCLVRLISTNKGDVQAMKLWQVFMNNNKRWSNGLITSVVLHSNLWILGSKIGPNVPLVYILSDIST